MKKFNGKLMYCAITMLFLSAPALAQTNITGKATDASGNAIPYTSVVLLNGSGKLVTAAFTDSLGNYRLESPVKGALQLTLSSPGFNMAFTNLFFALQTIDREQKNENNSAL